MDTKKHDVEKIRNIRKLNSIVVFSNDLEKALFCIRAKEKELKISSFSFALIKNNFKIYFLGIDIKIKMLYNTIVLIK